MEQQTKYCTWYTVLLVLIFTYENKFSGIIYSLFRGRQHVFLPIFGTKFVVKVATNILKRRLINTKVISKIFLNREFSTEK